MKPTLLTFFLLIVSASFAFSQKIEFHLDGRINKIENASHLDVEEFPSSRSSVLSDSTLEISFGRATRSYRSKYSAKLGFEFGVSADITLNDRLSVTTGLGLAYSEIEVDVEFVDFQFDVFRVDTISFIPSTNGFIIDCDRTINTIGDLREINNRPVLSTIDLMIPLGLQYKLLPGKLDLQIGGVLQTPVYADARRERYELVRSFTSSGIVCEYTIEEYQDEFIKRLSFMRVSLQGMIRYHLLKGVRVDVGVRKMLNNSFLPAEFGAASYDFRPLNYTFGFSYTLGKKQLLNSDKI